MSHSWSKLRLFSANRSAGYSSNLAYDWLSIVWAHSEQETGNGSWCCYSSFLHWLIWLLCLYSSWQSYDRPNPYKLTVKDLYSQSLPNHYRSKQVPTMCTVLCCMAWNFICWRELNGIQCTLQQWEEKMALSLGRSTPQKYAYFHCLAMMQ